MLPGALVKINGRINSTKYQHILAKNLVTSARKLRLGHRWTFQQHDDPNHTSKSTQKWFSEKKKVLQWTSQSSDLKPLNPIENMWSELKRAVHKCKPKDMKDLESFSNLIKHVFSNLIKHYRNRFSAIILARGGCHQVLKTGVPMIVKPFFNLIIFKMCNVSGFY